MNTKVREYLIEVARKRTDQTVTYQKLCDDCSLNLDMINSPYDRKVIGGILGEVSIFEYKNQRPLLSSLVVRSNDGEEGDGFYKLCEELGFGKAKKLKKNCFEYEQIRDCIDFWTNEGNYIKYK